MLQPMERATVNPAHHELAARQLIINGMLVCCGL
jgi:hypothetical protein